MLNALLDQEADVVHHGLKLFKQYLETAKHTLIDTKRGTANKTVMLNAFWIKKKEVEPTESHSWSRRIYLILEHRLRKTSSRVPIARVIIFFREKTIVGLHEYMKS